MLKVMITGQRKLAKSFAQRGLAVTLARCITRPLRRLFDVSQWLSPRFRELRSAHARWDAEHHVDTAPGNQVGWLADIDSQNWEHGRGYHPAPSGSLIQRLHELDIDFPNFTFIDFGSGKGRSLFAASNFEFRRIVGVEFNQYLHDVASRNVTTYKSPNQKCFHIEPVHADAAAYELPEGPCVYYFYDPFAEPVMRPVVQGILEKHLRTQEKCFIVYFNPVFAEYFEESQHFRRLSQGTEFEAYWNRTRAGNKDANEFTSELDDAERFVVYESEFC